MAKRTISVTFDAEDREQLVDAMTLFIAKLNAETLAVAPVAPKAEPAKRTAEELRAVRLANLDKARAAKAERSRKTARENPTPSEASRSSIADAAKRLSGVPAAQADPKPAPAPKASGMDSDAVKHLTAMLSDMFVVAERSGKVMWGRPEFKRAKLDREHVWSIAYELCDSRHGRTELSVEEVAWFVAHPDQLERLNAADDKRFAWARNVA